MIEFNPTGFQIVEYAAWAVSGALGLWMVFDLVRTDRTYSEDLLISSKEGELEDILGLNRPGDGDRR